MKRRRLERRKSVAVSYIWATIADVGRPVYVQPTEFEISLCTSLRRFSNISAPNSLRLHVSLILNGSNRDERGDDLPTSTRSSPSAAITGVAGPGVHSGRGTLTKGKPASWLLVVTSG